jgi:hypothetical protein
MITWTVKIERTEAAVGWIYCVLVIEALQLDLQKNFTLLKEMDGYAQGF